MRSCIAPVVVALVGIAVGFGFIWPVHRYTPDGIVYARFAERDAGMTTRSATLAARRYYEQTPMMREPRYRALVELSPRIAFPRSEVFSNRVLYPWAVSLGLRAGLGLGALFAVSLAAYLLFGPALYWLIAAFAPRWLAGGLAIGALLFPGTRAIAAADLTDMLGLLCFTVAIGAMLRSARRPAPQTVVLCAFAAVLFALDRPTPYLLVLPALAVWIACRTLGGAAGFAASLAAGIAYVADARAVGAFGLGQQLSWVYHHQPGGAQTAFGAWYRTSLEETLHAAASGAIHAVVPILAVIVALAALRYPRTRVASALVLGTAAASVCSLPLNPVASSLERVFWMPLVPVFALAAACAFIAARESVARGAVATTVEATETVTEPAT